MLKLGLFGGGGGDIGGYRTVTAQLVKKGGKIRHAAWPDCLAVCVIQHRLLETCARAGWEKRSAQVVYLVM